MNYEDILIFRKDRFAIGKEIDSDKYYLAIPVFNGMVEYSEYYEISKAQFEEYSRSFEPIKQLAQKCRERKNDEQLMEKPGSVRGSPI